MGSSSPVARQPSHGTQNVAENQSVFLARLLMDRVRRRRVELDGRTVAPQLGDELVALDAEDPAAEVRADAERSPPAQRFQGGLLDEVVGAVAVARQRKSVDAQARQHVLEIEIEAGIDRCGRHVSLRAGRWGRWRAMRQRQSFHTPSVFRSVSRLRAGRSSGPSAKAGQKPVYSGRFEEISRT